MMITVIRCELMYAEVVGDNYRKQDITLKPTVKVSIQTCWGYVSIQTVNLYLQ